MIKVQSVSSKIKVACFLPFLITTQGCITLPFGFNAEKPADTSAISTKNNKIQPLSPGAGSMKGAQPKTESRPIMPEEVTAENYQKVLRCLENEIVEDLSIQQESGTTNFPGR